MQIREADQKHSLQILLKSFGFKYARSPEADFVFDVRCLPNPYWEPELKELSGLDEPVAHYLEQIPAAQALLADISTFIETWIPYFAADNRQQLTIAVGCTGGQHRSVYMVQNIAKRLRATEYAVQVQHQNLVRTPVTAE